MRFEINKKTLSIILIAFFIICIYSHGSNYHLTYAIENDTQPPVIIIPNKSKFSDDVEAGTKFTIPTPQISDNGETLDSPTWSWSIVDPNGAKFNYTSNTRTFTPTVLGTYVITYTAEDSAGNVNTSNECRLNVVATEKPVITLHGVIEDDTRWDYVNHTQAARAIPKASAKDVNFNNSIIVDAPTVKNSKGNEVTVTESANGSSWEFTPDIQGIYTITYSAQGKYLSNTVSYTMIIGDGEAPTLDWDNKSEDLITTATVGDTWTFKFDMVSFDDNESNIQTIINTTLANGVTSTSLKNLTDYVTINMKNPNNETVNYSIVDNGLQYKFDKTGAYIFTIIVTDEAGHSTGSTYSYTINIYADEEAPTLTWGAEKVIESCTQKSIWAFKFDMIHASDNIVNFDNIISNALVGGLTNEDLNDISDYIKIEMKYITGEILEPIILNNKLKYQFMRAGTYVFTITLKDASGNEKIDTHLIQVAELPTYLIVFDTQGGNTINPYVKFEGDQVIAPENPTKTGYFFNGWYSDGVKFSFNTFKIMTARNFILVADWVKAVDESKKTEEGIQILGYGLLNPNWTIDSNIVSDINVNAEKLQNMYEGKEKILKTYDINILDGDSKVNPNGTITISIDIDKKMAKKNLKVVYISDDGETITDMNAKIIDNKLVFETTHFSNYAIVEINETNTLLIVLLCIMAAVLIVAVVLTFVIIKLKKQDN